MLLRHVLHLHQCDRREPRFILLGYASARAMHGALA